VVIKISVLFILSANRSS